MDQGQPPHPPPASTDLEGWRKAINDRLLPTFRLEAIAAALQDLGPLADSKVRNPLAKHLSDAMTKILRQLVGTNHSNQGEDIIYRVHSQLFDALLDPHSADGRGLREAFTARVSFRIKDAIATEQRHSRIPTAAKVKRSVQGRTIEEIVRIAPPSEAGDDANDFDTGDDASFRNSNRDLTLLHGVRDLDQRIDIKRFLAGVPDERKRLAFYLYMDDVPFGSKRAYSIAQALDISAKTAKDWVEEVLEILGADSEIQELQRVSLGDNT
jgi:hypothetical protein